MTSMALLAEQTSRNDFAFERALDGAMDTVLGLTGTETTELLLVRNAEPDYALAATGAVSGPPLSELGRRQAMRLATRLRGLDVGAVYSSTTRAAVETAAVVAAAGDMQVVRVPELRDLELNAAALNGTAGDRQKLEAEHCLRFINDPRWDSLRGVESTRTFRHRTIQAVEAVASNSSRGRAVIVTQQANINAYLSMVLGIERDMFFQPECTSISTVRIRRDLYGVQGLNDYSHLPADCLAR